MLDNEEENPIANPSNPRPKEDWNLKWFTTLQDKVIELSHELRKHRHPTQYQLYLIAKIKEAFNYWHSDVAGWETIRSTHQLKEPTKVVEQKQFLKENQVDTSKE